MNLYEALRKPARVKIAFVGSGGKTTALFQLARAMPSPVVVTCSTHLGAWQTGLADRHMILNRADNVTRFVGQYEGVTLITGPLDGGDRYLGLEDDQLAEIGMLSEQSGFSVLVEADGSRQRALKAPASHEPAIPGWVEMVAVVAGLSGLGQLLGEEAVHRPERFSALSGLQSGDAITEEGLARVLKHPDGGLKGIPESARRVLILNQADNDALINAGLRVATKVKVSYSSIMITSLTDFGVRRVVEPVAGILLAGGGATRFGQPKMLLPWNGKPIVRQIAETAFASGLDALVVVTGAWDGPIRQALEGLPVMLAHNYYWQAGQSGSIRTGLIALPEGIGASIFLLSDQPQVTKDLIESLVIQHQRTLAPITAPRIQGQRANPVLFDQVTFPALMALQGDMGGRALFEQVSPDFLEWNDVRMLLDIDTPDDYARLRGKD